MADSESRLLIIKLHSDSFEVDVKKKKKTFQKNALHNPTAQNTASRQLLMVPLTQLKDQGDNKQRISDSQLSQIHNT